MSCHELLPLKKHLYMLSNYFGQSKRFNDYPSGVLKISYLLNYAAHSIGINYRLTEVQDYPELCGFAEDWNAKQARYLDEMLGELAAYNFTFTAYNIFKRIFFNSMGEVSLKQIDTYLRNNYNIRSLHYYNFTLEELLKIAKYIFDGENYSQLLKEQYEYANVSSGLVVALTFSHALNTGLLELPNFDSTNRTDFIDFLKLLQRILALSIQSLLIAKYKNNYQDIYDPKSGNVIDIATTDYVKQLHLKGSLKFI